MDQVITESTIWHTIEGVTPAKQVRFNVIDKCIEIRNPPSGWVSFHDDQRNAGYVYQLMHYKGDQLDEIIGLFTTVSKAKRIAEHFTPNVKWGGLHEFVGYINEATNDRWELNWQRVDWEPTVSQDSEAPVDMGNQELHYVARDPFTPPEAA